MELHKTRAFDSNPDPFIPEKLLPLGGLLRVRSKCSENFCTERATSEGRCQEHQRPKPPGSRGGRRSAKGLAYQSLYKSKIWALLRNLCLSRQPLCQHCILFGISTGADTVDHVVPHKGNVKLFRDLTNLKSLCRSCHTEKTKFEMRTDSPWEFYEFRTC